ncbi:MAG: hypothetical protein WC137_00895 [Alphaproteobacteria bacterium]
MKKIFLIFSVFTFAILTTASVRAADNGCTNDNNEFINQTVALCTTHAYNIGKIYNDSADKQETSDIIALKTTIMTQQMKKQYDFLDVMVKRLKTQLQKSILTAKVQAAGGNATDDSSSSSSKSNDKAVIIAGAENCQLKGGTKESLACIQRNIGLIKNESSLGNAKKQLDQELKTYALFDFARHAKLTGTNGACESVSGLNKNTLSACLNAFNVMIIQTLENNNNTSNQTNNRPSGTN